MRNAVILNKLHEDKLKSRQFKVFKTVLNREATRRCYTINLDDVLQYLKVDSYAKFCDMDANVRQDKLEEFLMDNQDKSFSFGNNHVSAVTKFLSMNRAIFWKAPLQALIPRHRNQKAGGIPYVTEEIEMMLDVSPSLRTRWLILFFVSTGARPGAISDEDGYLQIKDLREMPEDCATFKIYRNTSEEYDAFLTKEAYKAFKDYLTWRESRGEIITPESPIFAPKTKTKRGYLSSGAVSRIMFYVVKKAGVKRTKVNAKKFDKSLTYGFRKRLNTILKLDNNVNSNIAEKLMGHKNGLDGTYLKPTTLECFAEFRKATKEITIDPTARLRVTNIKLNDQLGLETKHKVLEILEAMDINLEDLKEFSKQKRKDRKY